MNLKECPMERRIKTNGLRTKERIRIMLSLPLFASLAIFTPVDRGWSHDSIIISNADSSNKNAVFFQKEKPIIRLRSLEEASGPLNDSSHLSGSGSDRIPPADVSALEGVSAQNAAAAPEEEAKLVNIVIPASPAVVVKRRDLSIPFPASISNTESPIVSKGLLYSNDNGQNWHESGPLRSGTDGNSFVFNAPSDGEYWFSLRLILQDGTETASRAQKFRIETETDENKTPSSPGTDSNFQPPVPNARENAGAEDSGPNGGNQNEKMVQGLLSLTKKNESSPNVRPTGGTGANSVAKGAEKDQSVPDPLTSRLNELGQEAPTQAEKPVAEIPFPGKIDRIERGKTKSGAPGLSIRWFQPIQIGGETADGKIRIERAPGPDGPWSPIDDDAVDIDVNAPGYWFAAKENDSDPFYLRTVSVVKIDGHETEWIDALPRPLKFSLDAASGKSGTNFSNVSIEAPAKTDDFPQRSGDGPIKAWEDPIPNSSETKKLADALENKDNNSVVDKTASINQTSPDAHRNSITGNDAQRQKGRLERPQLTDPRRLSVNPIFNFGLSAITGKDRNGNPLPSYSEPVAPPPSQSDGASGGVPNIPPPPRRSIFMSQTEYRRLQLEYEQGVEQAKLAAQRKAQGALFNPSGQMGGTQATVTDAQGNQVTITEGSVLYQDEKGNMSATPFAGAGMNQPMMDANGQIIGEFPNQGYVQDMVFPDQTNFNDFSNVSQSIPINASPQMTTPNSENDLGYLNQNNSLEPYTNREQTLGGNLFNMESSQQQTLPSTLPPKPETQRF